MTSSSRKMSWRRSALAWPLVLLLAACGGGSGGGSGNAGAGSTSGLAMLGGGSNNPPTDNAANGGTTPPGQTTDSSQQAAGGAGQDGATGGNDGGNTADNGSDNGGGNGGNGGSGDTGSNGNTGTPGNDTPPEIGTFTHTAKFLPPIAGLSYLLGVTGLNTGESGDFTYISVDGVAAPVDFNIGGMSLGKVVPHACLSPLSLIEGADAQFNANNSLSPKAIALTQFLMSLDEDGNQDNGVQIGTNTHFAVFQMSPERKALLEMNPSLDGFGTEVNLGAWIRSINETLNTNKFTLTSAESARRLLARSLSACHAVRYEGNYTTEWENGGVNNGTVNTPLDPNPQAFSIVINGGQFSGTVNFGQRVLAISGALDLSGEMTFEHVTDTSDGRVVVAIVEQQVTKFSGQFDKTTQTITLKYLYKVSPLV